MKAVDCVSFEVERGSVFGMIGPNGAGKTTTIECLEGLRRPDGMCAQPKGRWIQGQIVGASRLLRPSGWTFRTLKRACAGMTVACASKRLRMWVAGRGRQPRGYCFDLLDFKRPGGGARRVVKVCSRRMRGARFLYLESSPRLWVASESVDGG